MRKKRLISMFMALVMAAGALTACGGSGSSGGGASSGGTTTAAAAPTEQKASETKAEAETKPESGGETVTLVFQVNDKGVVDASKDAIAKFEQEHNCKVEIISGFNGWPDYWSKLLTSIAGGTGPDVANLKETHLGELYNKGALLDLTDYIAADDEVNAEDFASAAWDAVTFDDKVYALPKHGSMVALYYNENLLAEKGYTEPPKTWDELKSMAKDLTDPSKGQYGFMWYELGTREPCFAWWYGFYLMADGGSVWKNGVPGQDFNINNQAGLDALNLQVDMLYKDESAVPPTTQETALAENGKVAMWMQGCWKIAEYPQTAPDLKWKAALLPGYKNNAHNALVDVYGVLKDSKNPELAYEFVKMLTSEENDLNFNVVSGQMPARKVNYEKEPYASDDNWQVFMEAFQLPETQPKPVCQGYEETGIAVVTELQKAWYNQITPEEALKNADAVAAEILSRNQ